MNNIPPETNIIYLKLTTLLKKSKIFSQSLVVLFFFFFFSRKWNLASRVKVNHDEFTPFLTRNTRIHTRSTPKATSIIERRKSTPFTHTQTHARARAHAALHSLHFLPDKELDDENNPLTRSFLVLPLGGGRLAKLEEEETPWPWPELVGLFGSLISSLPSSSSLREWTTLTIYMDITLWMREMHVVIWTPLVPELYQEEPGSVATWPRTSKLLTSRFIIAKEDDDVIRSAVRWPDSWYLGG